MELIREALLVLEHMDSLFFPGSDEFALDVEELSLCRYFLRLQCLSKKAQEEFAYVFSTLNKLEALRIAIDHEYAAMAAEGVEYALVRPASAAQSTPMEVQAIYTPGLAAAEIREESALLRAEAAAGSLILMIDDAIQRLRQSVWDSSKKVPYATDFTLGEIQDRKGFVAPAVYAAGNAYRHAKDWEGLVTPDGAINNKHANFRESQRTLAILESLIGLKAIADEWVCVSILRILSLDQSGEPSMGVLWDESLTDVGRGFAARYCVRQDAFERVSEALRHHSDYLSFEMSHSMNPALFEDVTDE